MAWTNKQTILSSQSGIASFDSAEFVAETPAAGNELQVAADLNVSKLQNPNTRFTVELWWFVAESGQWFKVAHNGFVGHPDILPTAVFAMGIDAAHYGKTLRVTLAKHSNESVSLRLREGSED